MTNTTRDVFLFDMTGRLVKTLANTEMQAGIHQLVWNSRDEKRNAVNGGIYFLRFETRAFSKTQKLIVVK